MLITGGVAVLRGLAASHTCRSTDREAASTQVKLQVSAGPAPANQRHPATSAGSPGPSHACNWLLEPLRSPSPPPPCPAARGKGANDRGQLTYKGELCPTTPRPLPSPSPHANTQPRRVNRSDAILFSHFWETATGAARRVRN